MKKSTPNIMVDDIEKTVEYYRDVLGFELALAVPRTRPWRWVLMKCGSMEIVFQPRHAPAAVEDLPLFKEKLRGGALTFYVDMQQGVNLLYESLQNKATDIVRSLHATFYGREEFSLRDCNDFVLTFAQR